MYLKRLELQGFKSFADKTIIDFEKGITGVVGPNGSGKSNISDSIRWVLGEQSAKTLRGAKMEDIIFSGTTKRRPVGFAEITLVLDNKDGKMPIDYSEVSVTRRVFRSGESEYYLNRTQCRLKDVKEVFMDTGVGIDGYSIIGQGRIDAILSTKSEDRRLLFEEAAGIVKYKTRKLEAEKKLQKTKENLVRINDIIRELNTQIDPLKNQSEKAKKYIELSEELKKLEVNLFIREIDRLNEQSGIIENQKQLIIKQIKFNEEKKDSLEKDFIILKKEIEKINKELDEVQENKYKTKHDTEKVESDINLYNEKISYLEKESNRLEKELNELSINNEEIKNEKVNLQKSFEDISENLVDLKQQYVDKNNSLNILENSLSSKEKVIENKKGDIIQILNAVAEKKSKINTIESFNVNIKKRIEQLEKDIEYLIENKSLKETEIENTNQNIKEISDKVLHLNKTRQYNYEKKNKEILEVNKISKNINHIKGEIQGRVSKRNLLVDMKNEYEGYYKSVKNALSFAKNNKDLGRGIKGVVAELINVDKEYEIAIEVALGSSLQNIVTKSEYDAKKIISYLKSNKLGRVTFLPMTSISSRVLNNFEKELLKNDGVINIASRLIQYDSQYDSILGYLLGRVVIVDNLETGIKISKLCKHSLKIVTLEGDVLNSGGSISGGSYNTKNTNLLSRDRNIHELNLEIENLNSKCSNNEKELLNKNNIVNDLEISIKAAEDEINNISLVKAKSENKLLNDIEEVKKINKDIEKTNNEKNHLLNENKDSDDDIIILRDEITSLNSNNLITQNDIKKMVSEYEDEKDKKACLEKEITDVRIKLASYEQQIKSISLNLDKYEEDKNKKQELIEIKNNDYKNCIDQKVYLTNGIKELCENKEKLSVILNELESKNDEIKLQKENLNDIFNKEQGSIKGLLNKLNDLEKSLNTLDVKNTKYTMQLENYNNKLWEEYELSYQMAIKYKLEIDNITKVQSEIRTIKNNIKTLGNINMDSIDEYEKVIERYNFMKEQNEDLLNARDSLNKVIKDMERKMKDQFLDNFKIIKENFSEVFMQLFGGGKADIVLEDEENILSTGIEIIAQPPGKKLQNISLLSGGEKALTAIALLFAILKLKPTPFCILDEIEAALDDANVYRFADYLNEFSTDTQFIVITHRKGTMESVDSLYGVTMEEEGVSKIVSVKLSEKLIENVS